MNINERISIANRVFNDIIESKELTELMDQYLTGDLPRIIFSGVGKNWYICEKIVKTYLSLGIHAEALDCVHALHGDLGMLMGEDEKLLIFVSKSGTTEELKRLVRIVFELKEKGIIKNTRVVGFYLNKRENIELADQYDNLILLPDWISYKEFPEFDSRNIVPTLSINTMQMVLDCFGIELFEARQNLVDNYVYNHLGGNNGKILGSKNIVNTL